MAKSDRYFGLEVSSSASPRRGSSSGGSWAGAIGLYRAPLSRDPWTDLRSSAYRLPPVMAPST